MDQLNLVPMGYKKRLKRKWYILFGSIGSVLACMTLITVAFIPVMKINAAKEVEAQLIQALETREIVETKEILAETEQAHLENAKVIKRLAGIDQSSHITRETLDVVLGNIPKGLRMNQVTMVNNDHTIALVGQAQNITKVAQYIVQLYNTGQFEILDYSANQNKDTTTIEWIDYAIKMIPKQFVKSEETLEVAITEEEYLGEDEVE